MSTLKLRRNTSTGSTPTTGTTAVGEILANTFDGKIFLRGNNGSDFVKEIGALSQRGVQFNDVAGLAPSSLSEYDVLVSSFEQGKSQAVVAFIHVPNSYTVGTQIKLRLGHYTPGVANNFKFNTVTTLIRKGTDAINSSTNQYTSTNTDQAISATANQYLEITYDLTNTSGLINSVAVNAGDIIKVALSRVTTTGTEDTNDVGSV
jgi:hypothetical protein